MSRNRVDEATTADWSFVGNPSLMAALGKVARKAADLGDFDAEDLAQDLMLWLAVRPEVQAKEEFQIVLDLRMAVREMRRTRGRRAELVTITHLEDEAA